MILFYTDIQIGKIGLFDKATESGYGLRLDNFIECADWIAEQILEHKPMTVINGGDTFNQIGMIDTDSLSATSLAISKIQDACNQVDADHLILLGNHDYSYIAGKTSSIDMFDFLSEAQVVKTATTFQLGKNHKIGLLPYYTDIDYITQLLAGFKKEKVDIIFSHIDIKGLKYSLHKEADYGVELDKIKIKLYNGHHHIYQKKGNVISAGSCLQHRYSELSERNGIYLFNSKFKETFIQNPVSPKLYKLKEVEKLKDPPDNSYVWLDYDSTAHDEEKIEKALERFPRTIKTKSVAEMKTLKTNIRVEGADEKEILIDYLDKVFETDLDKKKLKNMAIKLLD